MKKRLFAAVISFLMVLPQTAFFAAAQDEEPTEPGTMLLAENFEAESPEEGTSISGWNDWDEDNDATSASTFNSFNTISMDGTNRVASIKRTATPASDLGSYFFKKPLDVPSGTDLISIKFRTRRMDTNAAGLMVRLYGPNASNNAVLENNTFFYMNAGNGYLWWKNNAGAATYRYALNGANAMGAVGKWYDVEIVVDYVNKIMEAYIGGAYGGYVPLETEYSNIYGLPTAIAFGSQRVASYWGGMASNTSDAEFQIDDIVVKAYQGNTAYSSPENGEENVDVNTSRIDLVFNHEITDSSNAVFSLNSDETSQIPAIGDVVFDGENNRKVTLFLDGKFDYGKKYTLISNGVKNAYSKEMPIEIEFTTRERSFIINTPDFSEENGSVSAKIRIENEFDSEKPLTVVMAGIGENNQLTDIDYTVICVSGNDYAEPELTTDAVEGGKTNLFILDSFSELHPLTGEYVFSDGGLSEPSAVAAANATSISAAVDYDGGGSATISGNAENGSIAVLVLKPGFNTDNLTEENRAEAGNMIEYIGETEGGAYSEEYMPRIPVNNLGSYNAYASGLSTPASFRVFDEETVGKVLDAVEKSTKKTLADMLKAENPTLLDGTLNINDVLALDLTDYHTLLDKALVTDKIAGKTFSKISDIRTLYNSVLAETLEYEKTGKALVSEINDAVWSDLEKLLKDNDELLALEWDGDYKKINNKDNFYKKLAHDYTFTTASSTVDAAIAYIRESFSELAEDVLDKEKGDKKGSSSGGGGGGGGGGSSGGSGSKNIKLPAQPVVIPENIGENTISFSDIDDVPWAEVAIKELAKKNIINGMGDNKFEPDGTVTRAQFVKMLVLAMNLPMEFSEAPFDDVTAADWFYHYVHTAYKNGIVAAASTFGADRAISRAEMAVMCHRAMGVSEIKTDVSLALDFKDSSSIPEYAREAVAALVNSGIINGMGDNTFAPAESSSRAQAAKIIYGILQLKGGTN